MQLTILGCSGSVGAPGNPASGYLISVDDAPSVVMDLGPGTFASLQAHQDPTDAHVVFSHLHADHCLDFPSLMVWRRFHPDAPSTGRNLCIGPAHTPVHLGRLSSDDPEGVDDMSDTFAFSPWVERQAEILDRVRITPFRVAHPVETYAMRVEEVGGAGSFCYSGDTGVSANLVEAARGVDYFFCEAGWGPTSEGRPEGMHLSGADAGRAARDAGVKTLVLVHIQPWADVEATVAAARAEFDGDIVLGQAGMVFEV